MNGLSNLRSLRNIPRVSKVLCFCDIASRGGLLTTLIAQRRFLDLAYPAHRAHASERSCLHLTSPRLWQGMLLALASVRPTRDGERFEALKILYERPLRTCASLRNISRSCRSAKCTRASFEMRRPEVGIRTVKKCYSTVKSARGLSVTLCHVISFKTADRANLVIEARIWSADLTHRNGLGEALCSLTNVSMASWSCLTE